GRSARARAGAGPGRCGRRTGVGCGRARPVRRRLRRGVEGRRERDAKTARQAARRTAAAEPMSMTGRAAWVVLALAACLTAHNAQAETLRVGKAGREAFSFVPADVGQRTGIFRKHGLDLEIASFGGDARIQQAMAADGIDIGLGSGPGLAFIVKGSP